jgi:hypothetical protein
VVGDIVRFKDIKKEMRRKDARIQKLKQMVGNLEKYEERHYPYNYLEVVIRPQRMAFLHPYVFETDIRVLNESPEKTICYKQRMDLETLDLVSDKEAFARVLVEHMVREILNAVPHV